MPEILTYSLRASQPNSDEYFQTISAFSTEVLEQAFEQAPDLLAGFKSWSEQAAHLTPRTRGRGGVRTAQPGCAVAGLCRFCPGIPN